MMNLDEKALATMASAYADERLAATNPKIANSTYRRSAKMASPCFTGTDIEEAYEAGYRKAWEDKHEVPPQKEYYGG